MKILSILIAAAALCPGAAGAAGTGPAFAGLGSLSQAETTPAIPGASAPSELRAGGPAKSAAGEPAKKDLPGFSFKTFSPDGPDTERDFFGARHTFPHGAGTFTPGQGPVECYKAAPASLSKELSVKLCAGAHNTGPADCYRRTPASLTPELSVALCVGARNTGPADCYAKTPGSLDRGSSVRLCQGAFNTGPADCYAATPGSLGKELSIELCRQARDTGPADCYMNTTGMTAEEAMLLCSQHSYLGWGGGHGPHRGE